MKSISALVGLIFFILTSCAQVTQPQGSGQPTGERPGTTGSSTSTRPGTGTNPSTSGTQPSSSGSATTDQAVSALKEALNISATNASSKLSITDAFFKNMAIKILMPPEVKEVESTLRDLGMGKLVDDAILSMNRAAETAAKDAAPIFLEAIKKMNFNDAWGIVKGPNDAATSYLKKTTSTELTNKFKPVIQSALAKTDATKYWNDVFSNYNKLPFVKDVNSDLTAYVTQKSLDGLFYTLAQEEAKIRKDPAGTASDLIEAIFGNR